MAPTNPPSSRPPRSTTGHGRPQLFRAIAESAPTSAGGAYRQIDTAGGNDQSHCRRDDQQRGALTDNVEPVGAGEKVAGDQRKHHAAEDEKSAMLTTPEWLCSRRGSECWIMRELLKFMILILLPHVLPQSGR